MARPSKQRHVCGVPKCSRFYSHEGAETEVVELTLEEYESIRLMDHERLNQEQSAAQMRVARTTLQAIYKSAREKMADCLVNGKNLIIVGGNYQICSMNEDCSRRHCEGNEFEIIGRGERITMRIGVTYANGQIFQHFGHTEQFKIYDIEEGMVVGSAVLDTAGSGHGALAGFLVNNKVDVLICGGIGGGAQMALAQAGIRLFGGVSGGADEAVAAFLKNDLVFNPNVQCNHHGHGEGHNCGDHGEGHRCHH